MKKRLKATVVAVFGLLYLTPFYIVLVNSVKNYDQIVKNPLALPTRITFDNFRLAFEKASIGSLYLNSIFITAVSLLLLVLFSSMLAYMIARHDSRWSRALYVFMLCGIMVPAQLLVIPSIKTLMKFHLLHTFSGLFLFYVATYLSLGVFFYVEFIRSIPKSIEESGVIDGAGAFTIFWRLIFPLLRPVTATVVIFLGTWIWNEFLPPLYILGSNRGRTITTGIYSAIGTHTTEWNIVFACVILATLPIVLLYLSMQSQFRKGLTAGAVKG